MFAALSLDARPLDHVPEMRNDAHLGKELAMFVEVNAPRIAAPFSEDLEEALSRMIAPHPGIHPLAFTLRRAGFADVRRTEHTVATVQPAIRPPRKRVEHFVGVGGKVPAVQENLRITPRLGIVPIGNWHEHQVRRRADPHTTETDLESAHQVQVLHEHRALVEFVVAIGILEHQDAVLAAEDVFKLLRRRLRVRERRVLHAQRVRSARSVLAAAALESRAPRR